ncbi:MAG: Crp/Fnr family transcriptional regulator [Oligoflexus sp.]
MQDIADLLAKHRFFYDLSPEWLQILAHCGQNAFFKAGSFLAKESDPADVFYVMRSGIVAIETYVPGHGSVTLQTLSDSEVIGWSWLFPPHKWVFDVHAFTDTHVIRLDGKCLRKKCEADPAMGYELLKRFSRVMIERLQATRLRLIDMYGNVQQSAF